MIEGSQKINNEEKVPVKATQERLDVIKELRKLEGNKFDFNDFGNEELEINIKKNELNERAIEELDAGDTEIMGKCLKHLKSYIAGPIFTDKFHEKHRSNDPEKLNDPETRFGWEKTNLIKLSEKARKYYHDNRLNISGRIHNTIGFLKVAEEIVADPYMKDQLKILIKNIPENLANNNALGYNTSSDEEKIKTVEEFSEIIKQAIELLERKAKIF